MTTFNDEQRCCRNKEGALLHRYTGIVGWGGRLSPMNTSLGDLDTLVQPNVSLGAGRTRTGITSGYQDRAASLRV